jgi:hypothetical protein
MPRYTGSGSIAVLILNLEVLSCFTSTSPWGNCLHYPLNKWLVGLGEEKNLLALPGIELQLHICPAYSLVTIPTGICGCQAPSCTFRLIATQRRENDVHQVVSCTLSVIRWHTVGFTDVIDIFSGLTT